MGVIMIIIYKVIFWTLFFLGSVLYRLVSILGKLVPAILKLHYIGEMVACYKIWRGGDRYYQTFKILPALAKKSPNMKILYMGVQSNMNLNLRVLKYLFPNVVCSDIDRDSEKYCQGMKFIQSDVLSLEKSFKESELDAILISGVYYFYPELSDEFLDESLHSVHHVLKDNGILITGVANVYFNKKYKTVNDSPVIKSKFLKTNVGNKSIHMVSNKLITLKKTKNAYGFECFKAVKL